MKVITEEDGVQKEWYEQANKQTLETLPAFLNHLLNDYQHDYGTICHAITAGGIATMYAMNQHDQGGITGFQAGAIMWEFITNWNHSGNKTGMKLIDYDDLLYPQYEQKVDKIIPKATWDKLQEEAIRLLETDSGVREVRAHWRDIKRGIVPFGYKINHNE